ncbi:EVE domain-containing protein [Paenibacillus algorifonticola]|nr:EVE domain-containing protein [Paenibacillus algorifonticola]
MEQDGLAVVASDPLEQRRYWIGVVSEAHVRLGVEEGFAQLCHGKEAALKRMRAGDWLIYYSPRTEMNGGEALQAFTAIGQVIDDRVYPHQMSETFIPFRRDVRFLPCQTVKIADLLDDLTFTSGKRNWGYSFRFGQIKISQADFLAIATKMLGESMEEALKT